MKAKHYWSDGLTWACNSGMFVFGIAIAILGAILPSLFERIEMNPAEAGGLFLFLNLGALIITWTAGPVFDRFGFKTILVLCSILTFLALLWMAGASNYQTLALSCLLLGFGGGGLNAGTNALVADLYPGEQAIALNRLGVFFGVGTFFIPLLTGAFLDAMSIGELLRFAAVLGLIPATLFLLFRFPPGKHQAGFPVKEVLPLLSSPYLLLLGALLFFQSGNEITTGGWLTTFLVDKLDLSPSRASFYLSALWAAMVIGRLGAPRALEKVKEATLVQIGALVSLVSVVCFILFPHPIWSFVSAFVIGLGMSFIFPSVLGEASARFPAFSGTVLGALIGIALFGGMTIPWVAGLLVQPFGTASALSLPVIGFAAVFLLQTLVRFCFRSQAN